MLCLRKTIFSSVDHLAVAKTSGFDFKALWNGLLSSNRIAKLKSLSKPLPTAFKQAYLKIFCCKELVNPVVIIWSYFSCRAVPLSVTCDIKVRLPLACPRPVAHIWRIYITKSPHCFPHKNNRK